MRVGVAGATGYAGQELVRLLARHPHAQLARAMASSASSPQRELPGLAHLWDGTVVPLDLEALGDGRGAVFLALPEEASAEIAPRLLARGVRVFDLSGAFRLRDAGRARTVVSDDTAAMPPGVVYGLTEPRRAELRGAPLVSCPGCYPTAAVLALGPLVGAGLVAGDIVIDAKSGISGAGKAPSERTHFSECHGNVSAYGVFAHRHAAEIEQELGVAVTFVPHLVPLDRGILETIYTRVRAGTTRRTSSPDVYRAAYEDAPFVRLTGGALPGIRQVAYTNFCDIGWTLDAATRPSRRRGGARQPAQGRRGPGRAVLQRGVRPRRVRGAAGMRHGWTVLKLGGELLEEPARLRRAGGGDRPRRRPSCRSWWCTAAAAEIDAALDAGRHRQAAGGWGARHRCGHARRGRRGARRRRSTRGSSRPSMRRAAGRSVSRAPTRAWRWSRRRRRTPARTAP